MKQDPTAKTVNDPAKAMEAFLNGEGVKGDYEPLPETESPVPYNWELPLSIIRKVRTYKKIMDANFPELRDTGFGSPSELGLSCIFENENSKKVRDVELYKQRVTAGRVVYSDLAAHELYKRIEERNKTEGTAEIIQGHLHFHPKGISGPSLDDLREFKVVTKRNSQYQKCHGWIDMTKDCSIISDDAMLKDILEEDAVIISPASLNASPGDSPDASPNDSRLNLKVHYGYTLFMIFLDEDFPSWHGVGEHKRYSYNILKERFRLLEAGEGIELKIVDDSVEFRKKNGYSIDEIEKKEGAKMLDLIEHYVDRLVYPTYGRNVVPDSVTSMPFFVQNPDLAKKVENEMPATALEFFALIGDALRFGAGSEEMKAVELICSLFSDIYKEGGYEEQLRKAEDLLADLSPQYRKALELKRECQNA
ncbi:hypothetical protein ACFL6I_13765 [candidate division KSB1 bacterium]